MARRRPKAKASIDSVESSSHRATTHLFSLLFITYGVPVRLYRWCHETLGDVSMFITEIGFIVYRIACLMLLPRGHDGFGAHKTKCYLGWCKAKYLFFRRASTKIKIRSKQSFMCVLASHANRAYIFFSISHRVPCGWFSFSCKQIITRYMIPTRWDVCLNDGRKNKIKRLL